jgi:hypothetical protein
VTTCICDDEQTDSLAVTDAYVAHPLGQSVRAPEPPLLTGITGAGVAGASVGAVLNPAVAVAAGVAPPDTSVAVAAGVPAPATAVCVSSVVVRGLPQATVTSARVTIILNVKHFMKMVPR